MTKIPARAGRTVAVRTAGGEGGLRARRAEVVVVLAACAVRAAVMFVIRPADLDWVDSPRYARIPPEDAFFGDFWAPAGYPLFLAGMRTIWNELAFTTFVQHGLGVASVVLLMRAARHLGVRSPFHVVAGLAVAVSADFAFLEHLLMTESLFLFALAVFAYAAARSLAAMSTPWLAAAGVAAVVAGLIRANALALVPLLAVVAVVADGSARDRLVRTAAAVVPAGAVLGLYVVVATSSGPYTGLSDMNGWTLYGRVAPFADCDAIDADELAPDAGVLCEETAAEDRWGPYFYTWEPASPARAAWGLDQSRNDELRRFATAVIRAQPGAYLRAVAKDVVRLVDPSYDRTPGHGQAVETLDIDFHQPELEAAVADRLSVRYDGTHERTGPGLGLVAAYQRATRLPGLLTVAAVAAALRGLWRGGPARRRAVAVIGGAAAILLVSPILFVTWDFRYTLPALPLLFLAGLVGSPVGDPAASDASSGAPPDDEELLAEQPPQRRAAEVGAGQAP